MSQERNFEAADLHHFAGELSFCVWSAAMGKSAKSTSSTPGILKHTCRYAGAPTKKPSCAIFRSVLVQTEITFDNQIRKLPGGPPPPPTSPTAGGRSVTVVPSGISGRNSPGSDGQAPLEIIRLDDGTTLVERRGNFMGPPPPTSANQSGSSPASSSSS